jgi:hypothetical protein
MRRRAQGESEQRLFANLQEAFAHLRVENASRSVEEKTLSIAEQIKRDHPNLSDDEIRELLKQEGW